MGAILPQISGMERRMRLHMQPSTWVAAERELLSAARSLRGVAAAGVSGPLSGFLGQDMCGAVQSMFSFCAPSSAVDGEGRQSWAAALAR